MKNALIYSPNFIGHRQVYVFVIANELLKSGYKVFIAGNFTAKLKSTFYLDQFNGNSSIIRIDLYGMIDDALGITNKEFIELQKKYNIELTFFTEADNHLSLFSSQILSKRKKLEGRIIGIFLRPFYVYKAIRLIDKFRYLKHLQKTWRSDSRFFHEILNPYFGLLDVSLHIDDYFASKHKNTIWLPDVFQQYADNILLEEYSAQRIWIKRLADFKNKNESKLFLLYFGAAQHRRGYDRLLKLAVDNSACFIHCGLRSENDKFSYDVDKLRSILKNENRLFETNEYLTDPASIEYFFKSVNHLVLPYNNFPGSSGVMLQALGFNIPVLVPDNGVMGYRVKKYNLGQVYNEELFETQFLKFMETPKEIFSKSIEEYMKNQSVARLKTVLFNTIKN